MKEKLAVDYEKLGRRISKIRSDKDWSQNKLADEVQSSRKHISLIETGNAALSLDLLADIANTLGVSADDLLVDSLTHSVSTADSEIHQMLVDCNKTEEEILTEMVKALKAILYRSGI